VRAAEIVRINKDETSVTGVQARVIKDGAIEQVGMVRRDNDGNRFRFHHEIVVAHFIKTHAIDNGTGVTRTACDSQEHSFRIGIVSRSVDLACRFGGKSEFAHD